MARRTITRRKFMQLSAAMTAGSLLAACGAGDADEPAADQPAAEAPAESEAPAAESSSQYNEAPMLKAMVDAGDLPPVDDRLPVNPRIVTPIHEVGTYSESIRGFTLNETDRAAPGYIVNRGFIDIPTDLDGFGAGLPTGGWEPYLAESFEWNGDATQLTINMREGMKWSDGEPFTSADVLFLWEDMWFDEEYTPIAPTRCFVDGQPVVLETPDDYTLVFNFPAPYPTFPFLFRGRTLATKPKHHLTQWHPKYTDGAEYTDLRENDNYLDPDFPVVTPWLSKGYDESGLRLERNPYFCAVDTAGNQLPYCDNYVFPFAGTQENAVLMAIAGQIDVGIRNMQLFESLPTLRENEERGDYRLLFWPGTSFTTGNHITINYRLQNEKDRELAEFFRNKSFRNALSMAINRDEINETLYFGAGRPASYALASSSPYWDDDMDSITMINGQFDMAQVDSIFDELGLEKGDDGMRTFPSGEPVTIILDAATEITVHQQVAEMVVADWRDAGLDARLNAIQRSVLFSRWRAGESHTYMWGTDANEIPLMRPFQPIFTPKGHALDMLPVHYDDDPEWLQELGPPEGGDAMFALQNEIKKEIDPVESKRLHKELFKYHVDWQFDIHIVADVPLMVLVNNRVGNCPEVANGLQDFTYAYPEQFYIKY